MDTKNPTDQPVRRFWRVGELIGATGLTKPFILGALRRGEIEAVRLGGCLLLRADSVEKWLDEAEPWRPRSEGH